jgi:FlaA1/EpsC-like NDP-sugar epimerase
VSTAAEAYYAHLRRLQLRAMGREEKNYTANAIWPALRAPIVVTGGSGQIGSRVVERLRNLGAIVHAADITPDFPVREPSWPAFDIRDARAVKEMVERTKPGLLINLAAAKLAPQGELDPWETISTSVLGVKSLVDTDVPLLHVSTCKAADPEIAYGAGKLAAEKLALAGEGNILRLYNIPEAGPSMLTAWVRAHDRDEPIFVSPCTRYTATLREAVGAVCAAAWLTCADLTGGARWAIDPGEPVTMVEYAQRAFPGADIRAMMPRRGDRYVEPLCARCETVSEGPAGLRVIQSQHDG